MTTSNFERLLGSVLDAGGPQTVPPSLVEAALTEARTIPQRRALVPALDRRAWPSRRLVPKSQGRLASAGPLLVVTAIVALAAVGSAILFAAAQQNLREQLPPPFGPARNGVIVTISGEAFAPGGARLVQVDPSTRTTTTLLDGGAYVGAAFSPDGRRLAFVTAARDGASSLYLMNADGSGVRELLRERTNVAWAPDGNRIAFVKEGRLAIHDLVNGITASYDLGFEVGVGWWRSSHDQLIVWDQTSLPAERDGIYLVNADGTGLRSLFTATDQGLVVPSPDGSTIAYSAWPTAGHIHLLDIDTGVDRELTYDGSEGLSEWPQWFSPDGRRLLIGQQLEGTTQDAATNAPVSGGYEYRHVIVPVAGGGPAVVLGSDVHQGKDVGLLSGNAIFSPDGTKVLAVYDPAPTTGWQFDPAINPNERLPTGWLFDAATGRGEPVPQVTSPSITWQRLAP